MSNVEVLNVKTTLPIPPERVIQGALTNHGIKPFKRVMIIGVREDGEEYLAFSHPNGGDLLWELERAKQKIMR